MRIRDWIATFDVLQAKHTIRPCILGLDVLTTCPHTQPCVKSLKDAIRKCTKVLNESLQANYEEENHEQVLQHAFHTNCPIKEESGYEQEDLEECEIIDKHTCVPEKIPGFKFEFESSYPNSNLNLKICNTRY